MSSYSLVAIYTFKELYSANVQRWLRTDGARGFDVIIAMHNNDVYVIEGK